MIHAKGPLLSIDVTDRTTTETRITPLLESFVGGRGVATKLAHDRIPFDVDPISPSNRIYFTTGPLQTATMSFTGRMNCTSVSPLTDGLLSSNAGGFLSGHFVGTGYSAVELTGKSDEFLAIHVSDTGVRFEPIPELTDALVSEVSDYMDAEHGVESDQIVAIGPAGEHQVRYASIMTSDSRAFGRGGLGAVLGAKNVKCITFTGESVPDIDIADVQSEVHQDAATADHIMKRQGTTSVTTLANEMEAFPTGYWEEQSFEAADEIGGPAVEAKKYKRGTCARCAFACKLPTRDEDTGLETEGPEYETVFAFGSNPKVDDIVAVMKSNELCDELGLDTISAGNTITAYLKANDEFGNDALIHDLIKEIAYRDGDRAWLAEGLDRCADRLGVKNWTVKGMEPAAHDGRVLNGQGLAYATANRGADHMYSCLYSFEYPLVSHEHPDAVDPEGVEGKAALVVNKENLMALNDSGIICKFSRYAMTEDRYEALLDASYAELLAIGGQIVDLERHFNNQRGFTRSDDELPFDLPELDAALDDYYDCRGWMQDGTVPTEKIRTIDL